MKNEHLQKIIHGPIYLLEGNDGKVYGNSQWLAKEVFRLREAVKAITREANKAAQSGCNLTEKAIYEWSNETLGEPSVGDAIAGRTDQ